MIGSPDTGFAVTAAGAAAGLAFGSAYFAVMHRGVVLYCAGARAMTVGALMIGRLIAALGFFALVAHWGEVPLLGALGGFLIARTFAVRAARNRAA